MVSWILWPQTTDKACQDWFLSLIRADKVKTDFVTDQSWQGQDRFCHWSEMTRSRLILSLIRADKVKTDFVTDRADKVKTEFVTDQSWQGQDLIVWPIRTTRKVKI